MRISDWSADVCSSDLAERTGHRQSGRHHYLRIGRCRFEDRIEGDARPALKAYFYSLRPALALCWERAHARGRVPMDLPTLLAGVDLSASLRAEIDAMLAHKAVAPEQGTGARMPEIDAFMQEEFGLEIGRASCRERVCQYV